MKITGGAMAQEQQNREPVVVERVQTGVRLEKHMLKVLKAIAEQKDMTLGDLLEGIVLHAFEGKAPFSAQTLKEIEQFKVLYGMTLKASDSHNLKERRK
jgi:Ribbon-helix-helix domain